MICIKKISIFILLLIFIKTYNYAQDSDDSNIKEESKKAENKNNQKEKKEEKEIIEIECRSELYLKVDLIKTIKFNNKLVLFDLSTDVVDLLKTKKYDSTDDVLNSNKYIYGEEKLKPLNNFKDVFQKALIDFSNELKEDCCYVDFKLLPDDDILGDNDYIISIMILEYGEGEYNLIKNKPTFIKTEVRLNKNKSEKKTVLLIKSYNQKSNINNPIEDLRIKKIAQKVIIDSYNILKGKYINKKYLL